LAIFYPSFIQLATYIQVHWNLRYNLKINQFDVLTRVLLQSTFVGGWYGNLIRYTRMKNNTGFSIRPVVFVSSYCKQIIYMYLIKSVINALFKISLRNNFHWKPIWQKIFGWAARTLWRRDAGCGHTLVTSGSPRTWSGIQVSLCSIYWSMCLGQMYMLETRI